MYNYDGIHILVDQIWEKNGELWYIPRDEENLFALYKLRIIRCNVNDDDSISWVSWVFLRKNPEDTQIVDLSWFADAKYRSDL